MTKKIQVPPADIILDVINGVPDCREKILNYYEGYINTAGTFSLYDNRGMYSGYYANHDLMQEMRINLYNSVPILRRKLILGILEPETIVIIPKNL